MPDYDAFIDSLKTGLADLLGDALGEGAASAKDRATAFLEDAEDDFKKWTRQLMDGDLSTGDFEALVKGKADLGRIRALLEVGTAKVRADELREQVIEVIKASAAEFVRERARG